MAERFVQREDPHPPEARALSEAAGKELTYEQVARQFGLKGSDVTNYLAYARRELRRIVLEQLREMTGSEEEFRQEAHTLLGLKRRL